MRQQLFYYFICVCLFEFILHTIITIEVSIIFRYLKKHKKIDSKNLSKYYSTKKIFTYVSTIFVSISILSLILIWLFVSKYNSLVEAKNSFAFLLFQCILLACNICFLKIENFQYIIVEVLSVVVGYISIFLSCFSGYLIVQHFEKKHKNKENEKEQELLGIDTES